MAQKYPKYLQFGHLSIFFDSSPSPYKSHLEYLSCPCLTCNQYLESVLFTLQPWQVLDSAGGQLQ